MIVIGHRGACGYLPAHTLEGYALAIDMGADYIEPDLVATRDGCLIARHEPNLADTTDVASRPDFAPRRRIAVIDGVAQEGWFASDFTLAEIMQLRARQDRAERPQHFNGTFGIPTFEDVIALAQRRAQELGRAIGIYPEIKHPSYHEAVGLPLERRLVAALAAAGWDRHDAPVLIQSFEKASLRALRALTPVRLVQLVDAEDLVTDAALAEMAAFAAGIAPCKRWIDDDFCRRAHACGLFVHAWTFGDEPSEYLRFYGLGVDGVFSDFPDVAVAARAC